jgi:hypothetical protein
LRGHAARATSTTGIHRLGIVSVEVVIVVVVFGGEGSEVRASEFVQAGPARFQIHAAQDMQLSGKLAGRLRWSGGPCVGRRKGEETGFTKEGIDVAGFVEKFGEEFAVLGRWKGRLCSELDALT